MNEIIYMLAILVSLGACFGGILTFAAVTVMAVTDSIKRLENDRRGMASYNPNRSGVLASKSKAR